MIYYRVTVTTSGSDEWSAERTESRECALRANIVRAQSEKYFQSHGGAEICFLSRLEKGSAVFGLVRETCAGEENPIGDYLGAIQMNASEVSAEEITLHALLVLLKESEKAGFIREPEAILNRLNLMGLILLHERPQAAMKCCEILIDDGPARTREVLEGIADEYCMTRTLRTELERIYAGPRRPGIYGHPVHYVVKGNDSEVIEKASGALLTALYGNGRLQNRRVTSLRVAPMNDISRSSLSAVYKAACGGAVMVSFPQRPLEDEEEVSTMAGNVDKLCQTVMEYRSRVLTLFVLPRGWSMLEGFLQKGTSRLAKVEIREDRADYRAACRILHRMCEERPIRGDYNLYAAVKICEEYYPEELRTIFEDWYARKMRRYVYTQYYPIRTADERADSPGGDTESCWPDDLPGDPPETSGPSAMERLSSLVGLDGVKGVIRKALNYFRMQKTCTDRGLNPSPVGMHMVFTGNPGTAKTTVARLFSEILKDNGVLSEGHLVELGRADLIEKYVGWTAKNVKEKFEKAQGGVLFIDEAYALLDDHDGSRKGYGDEAISTIVQEMENHREDLVVIFAGYPEEMKEFLDRNPGMSSRISFHVSFPDYTAKELRLIASRIAQERGVSITDEALDRMEEVFSRAMDEPGFGNGRYVRNAVEMALMNLSDRLADKDLDELSDETLTRIEAEDVTVPMAQTEVPRRAIGFV